MNAAMVGDAFVAPAGAGSSPKASDTPRLLLRVEEAAEALAVSRRTLYTLLRSGEIPVVRIGRAVRITVAALETYVQRLASPPALDTSPIIMTSGSLVHGGGGGAQAPAQR